MEYKEDLKPRVSIIGCGNVGMRYAYALMMKGLARQIILTDRDDKKLKGEVMDLSHGAPYIQSPVEIIAGDYPDIKNSDLVVLTAGASQKPGQSRLELVNANIEIFKEIIPRIMKYAPDAILLVVTNPVDILSYAAFKISGKNPSEVIGSGTVLDTARFRYLLGAHCRMDSRNIHAYILGEHGDTEFPVWSRVMIGGVLLEDYCPVCKNRPVCKSKGNLDDIFSDVKNSAYEIIERKGETSYGIGQALVRITSAIIGGENSVLPVSTLIEGFMGVSDVYLSIPSIVNRAGIRQVLPIKLSASETEKFRHSAETLKGVIEASGL